MSHTDKEHRYTGIEEYYVIKHNKRMRYGFTTGTCAAAAAKAAALFLLGEKVHKNEYDEYVVELMTPKGIELCLPLEKVVVEDGGVCCSVRKDAGDDPDVTDGIVISARIEKKRGAEIVIDGAEGVGRIMRIGLEQPVGSAAINKVPREMIKDELEKIRNKTGYRGGFLVKIGAEGGREIAERTFNPRLGIKGGISILGTSGIVEPMSESALIKSLETELKQKLAMGRKHIVVTLGNYGKAYLKNLDHLSLENSIKCSNYVGEVIDMAVSLGAESLLFVAHIGKFIKVAGGIMNTHSRCADGRAEIMTACAMESGIRYEAAMEILKTETTDEALQIIDKEDLRIDVMKRVTERISYYLKHRSYGRLQTEALLFSNAFGYLGETAGCRALMEKIKDEAIKQGGALK